MLEGITSEEVQSWFGRGIINSGGGSGGGGSGGGGVCSGSGGSTLTVFEGFRT